MSAAQYDFSVTKGATWQPVFRWASDDLVSVAVTAVTKACPAVVTAAAHGLPNGWPAALTGAQGMTQINSANFPPRGSDYKLGTVVDVNTVNFNKIDSSNFSTYVSGGFLVYPTPVDLSGVSAMDFILYDNANHDGTAVMTRSIGSGVTIDNTAKTIAVSLETAGLTGDVYYFKLVATNASVVTPLLVGTLNLTP